MDSKCNITAVCRVVWSSFPCNDEIYTCQPRAVFTPPVMAAHTSASHSTDAGPSTPTYLGADKASSLISQSVHPDLSGSWVTFFHPSKERNLPPQPFLEPGSLPISQQSGEGETRSSHPHRCTALSCGSVSAAPIHQGGSNLASYSEEHGSNTVSGCLQTHY